MEILLNLFLFLGIVSGEGAWISLSVWSFLLFCVIPFFFLLLSLDEDWYPCLFCPRKCSGSQRWRLSGCGHRCRWKDYCQWHSNPIRCHGQGYMIILMNNFFAVALACVVSKQPRSTWFHRWDNISQKDKVVCLNLYWHSLAMSPSRAMFSALPDPQVVDYYGLITSTFFLWFLIQFG